MTEHYETKTEARFDDNFLYEWRLPIGQVGPDLRCPGIS